MQANLKKHFGFDTKTAKEAYELTPFVRSCFLIGWKMALQRPAMTYSFPARGDAFDEQLHELTFDSLDPLEHDVSVSYVIFPGIMQGEDRLSKAKVHLSHKAAH